MLCYGLQDWAGEGGKGGRWAGGKDRVRWAGGGEGGTVDGQQNSIINECCIL